MKIIKVTSSAGEPYGHVPGHRYHDVDVTITRARSGRWTVTLVETWASCQGHDEELDRNTVMACARTLEDAVEEAQRRAEAADLDKSYTAQALSCAQAKAAAKKDEEASDQATIDSAIDLSEVSTEQLVAEIRSRGVTAGE